MSGQVRSGNQCSYVNCNRSRRQNRTLRSFRFPVKYPEICKQWIKNSGNWALLDLDIHIFKQRFVCDKHFEQKDLEGNRFLRRGTIPIPFNLEENYSNPVIDLPNSERIPATCQETIHDDLNANHTLEIKIEPELLENPIKIRPIKTYKRKLINHTFNIKIEPELLENRIKTTPIKTYKRKLKNDTLEIKIEPELLDNRIKTPPIKTYKRKLAISDDDSDWEDLKDDSDFKTVVTKKKSKKKVKVLPKTLNNIKAGNGNRSFKINSYTSNNINRLPMFRRVFVKMQLYNRRFFSEDEKKVASTLYFNSPDTYRMLRLLKVRLPSELSLKKWIREMNIRPGFV